MGIELRVTYDGVEPGLSEHRLSIASFGHPIALLLEALQRTASRIISQALDRPDYGGKGGKFATDAKLLDLELVSVEEGCATPVFLCTTRGARGQEQPLLRGLEPLERDLAQNAVERLLHDIEAESAGKMRNAPVRKYLASIPSGVTRQRYTASRDGQTLVDVEFQAAHLAEAPVALPRLIKANGTITSIGFEVGATFVCLKTRTRTIRCAATAELVDKAVELRADQVTAAVLETGNDKPILLWLRQADQAPEVPSLDGTLLYARETWGQTLEALAK